MAPKEPGGLSALAGAKWGPFAQVLYSMLTDFWSAGKAAPAPVPFAGQRRELVGWEDTESSLVCPFSQSYELQKA